MFSSDSNIETIAQLIEEFKKYATLKGEYLRLDAVDKLVKLFTATALALVTALLIVLILTFFSFAIAFTLETIVGKILAFTIVGVFYIFLLLLFIIFRKSWIERPLVKFFASLILE